MMFRAFSASLPERYDMPHNIAGIDVHKKLLVVVIVDQAEPDVPLQSRRFGTGSAELHHLSEWLGQYGVVEAVMESTAQYWKPVWMALEPHMKLHLAQAQSNKAPKGRKSDLADCGCRKLRTPGNCPYRRAHRGLVRSSRDA